VIERAAEFFVPQLFRRIDAKYPKDKRRHALLAGCAVGIIVASFEAYDDRAAQVRKLQTQVIAQNSRRIIYINGWDFEDNDTADKLLLVKTVRDKPTTIRLTKNPRIDQKITVTDKGGAANSAPITVLGNGNKIMSLDKYVMNVNRESLPFTFTGSDWIVE